MIILPLSSSNANLENSGGKGASLARLTNLGLPVPGGFIITTEAYQQYVTANHLEEIINASLKDIPLGDGAALERASFRIRSAFSGGTLPEELNRIILDEYNNLDPDQIGVAVRSSATTEDLPDLSFAGQQDTFLNIKSSDAIVKAVIDCWSSLWTARAIGYRMRNDIPHTLAALAVVVQKMVPSETSGVMFTANPLTGLLSETVIDATFGLGEALVSGQVEPDHFGVDSITGTIRSAEIGSKTTSTRLKKGGGVENSSGQGEKEQTLSSEQVKELVAAGEMIQKEYGCPQDIEWAFANDQLFILQSRPITSLFPLPRVSFDPLIVWFSFGAFQGVMGPMTPLGQEAIQRVVLGIGRKLGIQLDFAEQDVFTAAGERVWIKISDVIRNPLGNRILGGFLGIGEPGTKAILNDLIEDPRLGAGQGKVKLRTIRRLLHFFWPAIKEIPRSIVHPEKARERFDAKLEAYLDLMQIPPGSNCYDSLANFTTFMNEQGGLADALSVVLPLFIPIMAPSMAALSLIGHLLPVEKDGDKGISPKVLDVTRALPQNVTTEMDLFLWKTAKLIKQDPVSEKAILSSDGPTLALQYLDGKLPKAAQNAINGFLDHYGMRGVGEIDLGQPRWREDPAPVIESVRSYLQIPPEAAPDLVFEESVQSASKAIEQMAAEVRKTRNGRIKEKMLRAAAHRVRALLGARESPKFLAVRVMGRVRSYLLDIGEEFAKDGIILRKEDLFFLHVSELAALSKQEEHDWKAIIAERRLVYEREMHRRQIPRVLVSDGRTIYNAGNTQGTDDTILGSPVSPGVVEGHVRVVHDPRGAQLAPGEILVCRGTDPAWTPLFMAAGGLIMEVGGMMTHGSVVAREYGIPAVVGVQQATERLKNGQLIRLNGSTGGITIL